MDYEAKKKYSHMENILNKINQKYITLPESEVKRNNKILDQVINPLITKLKEKSPLFDVMFERTFYGGSFYDKIKVGKPEEYDLDIVFNLPLIAEPKIEVSDKPGYVHLCLTVYVKLLKRDEAPKYDKLDTLLDENNKYLLTENVLSWIESLMSKAFNDYPKMGSIPFVRVNLDNGQSMDIYLSMIKQYPAFTLKLTGKLEENYIKLDIDMVPCFQFTDDKWPSPGYRPNISPKRNKFLVVPKKVPDMAKSVKYWRLSFQEQERDLMFGHDYKCMKPVIKLLKKLRDQQKHVKIASYYIKTLFMWEVQRAPKEFWCQPLSYVFMEMLKKYAEALKNKSIPYYWNEQNNLIGHIKDVTCKDIGNAISRMTDQIDKNLPLDPFLVAKYLLGEDALTDLKKEVDLGKKHSKQVNLTKSLLMVQVADCVDSTVEEQEKSDYVHEKKSKTGDISLETSSNSSHPNETKLDRLIKMVSNLQEDNKRILNVCGELLEKVYLLENKVEKLTLETNQLKSKLTPSDQNVSDLLVLGDHLNITANMKI